ncbi:MAG: enoyl-CoA hydratase-related protein [Patulibacter sp.]
MPGQLLVDTPADGVLRLRISNPAKRGALDHPILDAIAEQLDGLGSDVRCVILTGEAGRFSSGYDIGHIPADRFEELAEPLVAHPFASAVEALDRCDTPVVAGLSGHTIGGGLELALCCDLRIARDDIKLGMPPAKLGLVYSHTGLMRFLDVIGEARTRDLFLRGKYIGATKGELWGLVNELVGVPEHVAGHRDEVIAEAHAKALDDATVAAATEIAGNAPLSVRGNKRVLRTILSERRRVPDDIEQYLIKERKDCFQSGDFLEGVQAFAQRRTPNWQGK